MSIPRWFRSPRVRRGLAASLVVLSAGGLILARTPAGASPGSHGDSAVVLANGSNSASFAGPGLRGRFALSHTKVLAGGERRVFAELDLVADPSSRGVERAPLAIAVVLDTSGSMGGEKIDQARRSVIQMLRDMRDDDEVAFVRYASDTQLVQPLARVGDVRSSLIARVEALEAGGGTNIPPALSQGLAAIGDARKGRVRRVVLVSDGLDSSRALAEQIARDSAGRGVTVSSMGIGLDFDERYMGGVAQMGHGNFAFVKDAAALAGFLQRELREGSATTAERVTARVRLPRGVRLVQAIGADARTTSDGVELSVGSLFGGDERRVMVELAATLGAGEVSPLDGDVAWTQVGADGAQARFGGLALAGTTDALAVEQGRDGSVFANATSVLASARELEAADAYRAGDNARAQALIDRNVLDLQAAAAAAPKPAAARLSRQMAEYKATKGEFAAAPAHSEAGKSAAKKRAMQDYDNSNRAGF